MLPNEADGMANSVDPDQTAPLGADHVCSALSVVILRTRILRSFFSRMYFIELLSVGVDFLFNRKF